MNNLHEFGAFYRAFVPDGTSKVVVLNFEDAFHKMLFGLSRHLEPIAGFTGWKNENFTTSFDLDARDTETLYDIINGASWLKRIQAGGFLNLPRSISELGTLYYPLLFLDSQVALECLPKLDLPVIYIVCKSGYYKPREGYNTLPIHIIKFNNEYSIGKLYKEMMALGVVQYIWTHYLKISTQYKYNTQVRKWREYLWRPGGPLEAKRYTELQRLM